MEREKHILERFNRRQERLWRTHKTLWTIFLVSGYVAAPTWLYFNLTVNPRNETLNFIDYLFVVSFVITVLSGAGVMALSRWRRTDSEKQVARAAEILGRLWALEMVHPELALLNELSELLGDEKAQASERRSFWMGILVNLIFMLLGFGLSYLATKLGWLR